MRKLLSVLSLTVLISCGNPLPKIDSLDLESWKKDKNACGSYRSANIETIRSQKEKLLVLKESQIIELLGRPDVNELYKRNQKFYYYYLEPGSLCDSVSKESSRLVIRFNAMGLAKEVAIE